MVRAPSWRLMLTSIHFNMCQTRDSMDVLECQFKSSETKTECHDMICLVQWCWSFEKDLKFLSRGCWSFFVKCVDLSTLSCSSWARSFEDLKTSQGAEQKKAGHIGFESSMCLMYVALRSNKDTTWYWEGGSNETQWSHSLLNLWCFSLFFERDVFVQ